MAYCGNCGANLADGATVCASCGKPVGATGAVTYSGGGAPGGGGGTNQLADWGARAGGILIDFALLVGFSIIGAIVGGAVQYLCQLIVLAGWIWWSVQVGQTGQSPGMRVVGLRCVSATTGQPIGGGMGVVRWICHLIDTFICLIGWLFPLWDAQRQTIADKITSTVVVVVPKKSFSLVPN